MFELVQVGDSTYYIESPAKIGLCVSGDAAYLIDSGNDKDAARKVMRILDTHGWTLAAIINTHSNADHIGGNQLLQQRTGCDVIASSVEEAFISHPILEGAFLYGGYPAKALRNKFLLAAPSRPTPAQGLTLDAVSSRGRVPELPAGLRAFALDGHFFGMIGVHTPDGVCFVADSVFSEEILSKYHMPFIYDVAAFLATLELLEGLEDEGEVALFVPSHAAVAKDIRPLAQANRQNVLATLDLVLRLCSEGAGGVTFEELLKAVFDHFGMTLDMNQYVLVGSTIRSYLSYLSDTDRLVASFEGNRLLWEAT